MIWTFPNFEIKYTPRKRPHNDMDTFCSQTPNQVHNKFVQTTLKKNSQSQVRKTPFWEGRGAKYFIFQSKNTHSGQISHF